MTNVELFRDGQSCNSVNYWVTRVQARPRTVIRTGSGAWPGAGYRPMGCPESEDGWEPRSWLVRRVASWDRQPGPSVTLQLCSLCPVADSSDSRNSPGPRDTSHDVRPGAARRMAGDTDRAGAGAEQERMVVRAELSANSQNITVWSECQHRGHRTRTLPTSHAACCTCQTHEPSASSCVITDIKRPLSGELTSVQWVWWAGSCDMWDCLHPLSTQCSAPRGLARCQDSWLGELRPAPRSAGRRSPLRRHEVPRGGERGRGRDGRLPPPQPDGHVPRPRHQHHGLEEHQPGKKRPGWWLTALNDGRHDKKALSCFCDNHAN